MRVVLDFSVKVLRVEEEEGGVGRGTRGGKGERRATMYIPDVLETCGGCSRHGGGGGETGMFPFLGCEELIAKINRIIEPWSGRGRGAGGLRSKRQEGFDCAMWHATEADGIMAAVS